MTDEFIFIDENEYINESNNSDCESENESHLNNEEEDEEEDNNDYYIKSDGINITYIKKENIWNPNFNLNSNHGYSISSDEENNFFKNPKYNIFQNSLVKSPKNNNYVLNNLIESQENNDYVFKNLINSPEDNNHILNLQNNLIKYSDSEDSFHSFLKNYNNYEIDDKNIKNKNDDEIIINNIIKKIKNNYS